MNQAFLEVPKAKYASRRDLPSASDLIAAIRQAYEQRDGSGLPDLHYGIGAIVPNPSQWFNEDHFTRAAENDQDELDVLLFAVFWAGWSQAEHSRDITQGPE